MRPLFRVLAGLAGLILGLTAIEVGLRLFAPQQTAPREFSWVGGLGPIHVPGQRGRRTVPGIYSFSYTNNALGFRGPRAPENVPAPGVKRVLFLGDSFTYGIGVDDTATFASIVQDRLGDRFEVINAGVAGTGTDYALNCFLEAGRRFQPDVVALFFFSNDFEDNAAGLYARKDGTTGPVGGNPFAGKLWTRSLPAYDWFITWSHLVNALRSTAIRWQHPAAARGAVLRAGEGEPAGRDETRFLIQRLQASTREAGAALRVFYVPSEYEVTRYRDARKVSPAETIVGGFCGDDGIALVSLTPALAGSPLAVEDLYLRDGHWSAAGHRVAAMVIAGALGDSLSRLSPLPD